METAKPNETAGSAKPPILPPPKIPAPAPKSKRQPGWIILTRGLVPAAVAGGSILILGLAAAPPRHVARAVFTVDWKKMPDVSTDNQATQLQKLWRKSVSTYMSQAQGQAEAEAIVAEINQPDFFAALTGNKKPPVLANEATAVVAIKRHLRVTDSPLSATTDRVVVQMRDNDPQRALAVVGCVVSNRLSKMAKQKLLGSLIAAGLDPNQERIDGEMDSIRRQLRDIESDVELDNADPATIQKYNALRRRLGELSNKKEALKTQRFLDLFNNPITLVEDAHVVKGGAAFYVLVLLFAGVVAAGACGIGLGLARRSAARDTTPPTLKPPVIRAGVTRFQTEAESKACGHRR